MDGVWPLKRALESTRVSNTPAFKWVSAIYFLTMLHIRYVLSALISKVDPKLWSHEEHFPFQLCSPPPLSLSLSPLWPTALQNPILNFIWEMKTCKVLFMSWQNHYITTWNKDGFFSFKLGDIWTLLFGYWLFPSFSCFLFRNNIYESR